MRTATAIPLLNVLVLGHICLAVEPPKPSRLDAHGDPMPGGAIRRLGTIRFQFPDHNQGLPPEYRRFRFSNRNHAIALSPDGETIAIAGESDKNNTPIFFIDTRTGKLRRGPIIQNFSGDRLQYTRDGKSFVLATSNWGDCDVANASTGRIEKEIRSQGLREAVIAVSADGKWMAGQLQEVSFDASLRIWEISSGKEIAKLPGRGAVPKAIVFGPDSKRLLLSSIIPTQISGESIGYGSDSKVAVACIDIAERKIVGQMDVGYAQKVALSADGETVAIESAAHGSVQIVHLPTGKTRCVVDSPSTEFLFAPDGRTIFTIDDDRKCALWDAATGKKIRELDGALGNSDTRALGFSKDGKLVVAIDGGWDSSATIVVWQTETGKRISRPPAHDGAVTCLAYTSDGKHIVSSSLDRTVRVWDCVRGEHVRIVTMHTKPVTAIAISHDDLLVASSSQTGDVRVSRIADGKTIAELVGLKKGAHALAFSADGATLFAGGELPEVFGWSIATGQRTIQNTVGQDGEIMGFGTGGSLLAKTNNQFDGPKPEKLELWRPTDRQPIATITIGGQEKHGDVRCSAVHFSPEGRMLVSSQISEYQGIRPSYGAAQLRVWERATGQSIRMLAPTITKLVAFSPNGRLLASGGTGRSGHLSVGYGAGLIIWDTVNGDKVGEFSESPKCIAFSPDGKHLASAGRDGTILIWESPKPRAPLSAKVSDKARDAWWPALGEETKIAYEAIAQMLDSPEPAVTLLRERVQPIERGDADTVARLIKQLDSAKFTERENAQRELIKLGDGASDLLAKALKGELSAEARRRLDDIVATNEGITTHSLRHHRAVAVLEWIGTPAAKEHLQSLTKGAPGARLTNEADAALKRMRR